MTGESHWTIDRFEGDFAVVETEARKAVQLRRSFLPSKAREGDLLRVTVTRDAERATLAFELDPEATRARAAEIARAAASVAGGDPGGDLVL